MEWGVQGGVVVVVARRGYKEGRGGNGGTCRAHPGRPGHCWPQHPHPPPPPSLELGLDVKGGGARTVGCCHTMSNQYELPRAVGPQRHISSKVALW